MFICTARVNGRVFQSLFPLESNHSKCLVCTFFMFYRFLYVIHKCLVLVLARGRGRRFVPVVGVRQTAAQMSAQSEKAISNVV